MGGCGDGKRDAPGGDLQELSNLLWSLASLACVAVPLIHSLSAAALRLITEMAVLAGPPRITNTAWALSALAVLHSPLLSAIAAASRRMRHQLCVQSRTNTAWAFAALLVEHSPLIHAIASASL